MISAFLKLKGVKSGAVAGEVRDRDPFKEGSIELLSVEHSITVNRDPATGQASGKRRHQPLTITKYADQTTPILYQMITTNERIESVELHFYGEDRSSPFGTSRSGRLYWIELKNALLTELDVGGRLEREAQPPFPLIERVSFVYESVRWEWLAGTSKSTEDKWSSEP